MVQAQAGVESWEEAERKLLQATNRVRQLWIKEFKESRASGKRVEEAAEAAARVWTGEEQRRGKKRGRGANTQQKEGGGEMSRGLSGRKKDGQGGARERENGEEEETREEESEGTTETSEDDVIEAPQVRQHRIRDDLDTIREKKQQKANESRGNQGQKKTPTGSKKK